MWLVVVCVVGGESIIGVEFFFFFQAEDGIRDLTVTGVQTCALPIFERIGRWPVHREEEVGPPEEKREGDEERNHRPGDFELQRALDSAGELRLRPDRKSVV